MFFRRQSETGINNVLRTSLAEFSLLYLRSLEAMPGRPFRLPEKLALSKISEDRLAVQVVLGMSKGKAKIEAAVARSG
jgi:hypothetical protein